MRTKVVGGGISLLRKIGLIFLSIVIMMVPLLVSGCSDGKDGADGTQWLTGTEAPSSSQGSDGDFYIDTDDYILYQKVDGTWTVVMTDFGKGEKGDASYIGYDGYVWTGTTRGVLQLTDPMEDSTLAETTLGLYGNTVFEEETIDTSNYVAIMSYYYENLEMTAYSESKITEIQFYATNQGFVKFSTALVLNVIEARTNGTTLDEVTYFGYAEVSKGWNTITFTTEISVGKGETLLLGGAGSTNVGLLAYNGVTEYDTYGNFCELDGEEHSDLISITNGNKDKLVLQISAYAVETTTTEVEEGGETEAKVVSGLDTAGGTANALTNVSTSKYPYVIGTYTNMAGMTVNQIRVMPTAASSGDGVVTLYVVDYSTSLKEATTTSTVTLENLTLTAKEWNTITLDTPITLGSTETIAFGASGDISYGCAQYSACDTSVYSYTGYSGVGTSSSTYGTYDNVCIYMEFIQIATTEGTTIETQTQYTFAEHVANLEEQESEVAATATETSYISGMKVSILGDSISTFGGVSDNGSVNDTISSEYLPRYCSADDENYSGLLKLNSVDDTWWMKTINECGMELLVNNSWRGTRAYGSTGSTSTTTRNDGWYSRCVNLHDNTLEDNENGEEIDPDIIVCFLGMNDYVSDVSLGSLETTNLSTLITKSSDGTYSYKTPTNFTEAYVIMVHKMKIAYPNSTIFCFTVYPEGKVADQERLESFNAVICDVAEYYNCPIVDLYNCGITFENSSTYLSDTIHPNTAGIALISECFTNAVLEYFKPI